MTATTQPTIDQEYHFNGDTSTVWKCVKRYGKSVFSFALFDTNGNRKTMLVSGQKPRGYPSTRILSNNIHLLKLTK